MLEPSNQARKSQRPPSRQGSLLPHPSAPSPQRGRQGGAKPRSGLQQLLLRLLSAKSKAPATRQSLSRRELRRQQRQTELMPNEQVRSKRLSKPPEKERERVIPLNAVRSDGSRSDASRSDGSRLDGSRSDASHQSSKSGAHPGARSPRSHSASSHYSASSHSASSHSASTVQPTSERGAARPRVVKPVSASDRHPDRHQPRKAAAAGTQRRSLPIVAFVQGMRLVILGVGVWAIAGTALSMWSPASRPQQTNQALVEASQIDATQAQQLDAMGAANLVANRIEPRQELNELAVRVAPLTQGLTDMIPGLYLLDLDNGDYFSLNGEAAFSAASMIKVPILIAFFQEVDAGNLQLGETLTIQQSDLASGSGEMQYAGVGAQYTALATATNMIIISDNTATNMLIRRLGGIAALNQRFQQWGLQQTVIHNVLPDLEGTNTTSPKELSDLLMRVSQGDLISMKSRDRMLEIMRRTVNNSLLPASLGEGATISHKTGDIGSAVGDTGLVDLPNGKRYAITAIVKRPHNDDRAYDLIVRLGAAVYDYLNNTGTPASLPAAETVPSPATNDSAPATAPQQAVPPAEATIPSTPVPNSR